MRVVSAAHLSQARHVRILHKEGRPTLPPVHELFRVRTRDAPGTGKTTAIRALLRAWEPWCAGQYVTDPERLFAEPAYLGEVLACVRPVAPRLGPTLSRPGQPAAMWSLVVAEDGDEFLRASARRDAGVALGRLLNLADGILGQGFKTLVLLTTN